MNSFENEYEENIERISENDRRIENAVEVKINKKDLRIQRLKGVGLYYIYSLRNFTGAVAVTWLAMKAGAPEFVLMELLTLGTAAAVIQPLFSKTIDKIRMSIINIKKNIISYSTEGMNRGRVFLIDGDDIEVENLDLYDRPRILEAYGVCESIFQQEPQEW